MDLIEEFIARYQREFDFYNEAAKLVAQQLEVQLQASGIRAIVTFRAKSLDRLETKLRQRSIRKSYTTVQDIYQDIVDLAGVRVALYFPKDRDTVGKLIQEHLMVTEPPKEFPTASTPTPTYKKRFSGYWATHYRVQLKNPLDAQKRFVSARVEIQVASVLMHAWAEVEHDLIYKPLQGTLSLDEYSILDEINGLVLSGEIALEHLQRAIETRLTADGASFNNHYELATFLFNSVKSLLPSDFSEPIMGRVDILFDLLRQLKLDTPNKLQTYVSVIDPTTKSKAITEQIIDRIIEADPTLYQIYNQIHFERLEKNPYKTVEEIGQEQDIQQSRGEFLELWAKLEGLILLFAKNENLQDSNRLPFSHIVQRLPLDNQTIDEIQQIVSLRNALIHGQGSIKNKSIKESSKAIQHLLQKFGRTPDIIGWPIPPKSTSKFTTNEEPADPSNLTGLSKINPPFNIKAEDLKEIYSTWKYIRQEYPGWVVCPKENRDQLWRYTEYWADPILKSIDKIPLPERLPLLFELNWRLELTLTPLFLDWSNKIEETIKVFNPFPNYIQIETATIKPDQAEYKDLDWDSLQPYWVALGFAVARKARETQDSGRFQVWMNRLEKVIKLNKEWQMRWFYDYCLFHLFYFDVNELYEKLQEWPETKDFPFWQIKRASILAEFGELKEAEKLAEEALTIIRSLFRPFPTNYLLFSQEAWAMALLKAIEDNKLVNIDEFIARYKDRWETLSHYRCNPWHELETLEVTLEGPRPVAAPRERKKKSFDPGVVTTTRGLFSGLNVFNLRPAYEFIRLHEEAALPVKCGIVTSSETIKAAEWVNYLDVYLAISTIVRTGNKEAIEIQFNRISVAALPQEVFDKLKETLIRTLTQAVDILTANKPGFGISYRLAISHLELLSRFCIRFPPEDLEELFNIATKFYRLLVFQQNYHLGEGLNILFKRLFQTMSYAEILKKIETLLCLPIPSPGIFEVIHPQVWVETMNYINWSNNIKLNNSFDRSSWVAPIKNLIKFVETGDYEARWRSTTRLIKLVAIDGLTKEEKKDFVAALWTKVDTETNLPAKTNLWDYGFLFLLDADSKKVKEDFRQNLLSNGFQRIVQRRGQYDIIPIGGLQNLKPIRELCNSTYNPINKNQTYKDILIDWSSDDAVELLNNAVNWWNIEKIELQDQTSSAEDKHTKLREQFAGLISLMTIVIFPRLANADEETKLLARNIIEEMEQYKFYTLPAKPLILFFDRESVDEIISSIRFGLNSMDPEEVDGSITGLYNWLAYSAIELIPPPPPHLVNELINRVVSRRQPGLLVAIRQTAKIIKNFPKLLAKTQLDSLLIALEYLITDTQYPNYDALIRLDNTSTLIPVVDIPEYRSATAKLAHRIFRILLETNLEASHPVLDQWKEICKSDPLPEVRFAWK